MKTYPSIPKGRSVGFPDKPYIFDKLDGSNLRFEWSAKRGFYKFGTRGQLFDLSHPIFGKAILVLMSHIATPMIALARSEGWTSMVVFCEYLGKNSFAGLHDPEDEMSLVVIDVAVDKKGFLSPQEFISKVAPVVSTPKFLGRANWTEGFRSLVATGELPTIGGVWLLNEGVVAKLKVKNRMLMAKWKTASWLERLKQARPELYSEEIKDFV